MGKCGHPDLVAEEGAGSFLLSDILYPKGRLKPGRKACSYLGAGPDGPKLSGSANMRVHFAHTLRWRSPLRNLPCAIHLPSEMGGSQDALRRPGLHHPVVLLIPIPTGRDDPLGRVALGGPRCVPGLFRRSGMHAKPTQPTRKKCVPL